MLTPAQRMAADIAAHDNLEKQGSNEKPENIYKVRVQAIFPTARAHKHLISGAWYVCHWPEILKKAPRARTEIEAWRNAWDKLNEG